MFPAVERSLISKDWLTLLFVATLCILVLTRFVYRKRLGLFLGFLFSSKYQNQLMAKQEKTINGFTSLLFIVQVISFSIFVYLAMIFFKSSIVFTPFSFIKVISFIFFFLLIKYILEKIIAIILDIESYIDAYNFQKINARNLFGLLLLPVNLCLVYTFEGNSIVFFSVFFSFLGYNLIVLFLLLKNYQKLIISKLFYFILYLCALEIAPYLVIYKFLIK